MVLDTCWILTRCLLGVTKWLFNSIWEKFDCINKSCLLLKIKNIFHTGFQIFLASDEVGDSFAPDKKMFFFYFHQHWLQFLHKICQCHCSPPRDNWIRNPLPEELASQGSLVHKIFARTAVVVVLQTELPTQSIVINVLVRASSYSGSRLNSAPTDQEDLPRVTYTK